MNPPVAFNLPALIVRYGAARRRRGITKKRVADDDRILRHFAAQAPDSPKVINRAHIQAFIDRPDLAASTRAQYLSTLRTFFRWCVIEGHCRRDPTLGVEAPKRPPSVPGALRRDQAAAVHGGIVALDHRARLMLCLAKNEALRRVEIARMQLGDIDRRAQTLRVRGKARGGRGGVTREVPLSDETLSALDSYLAAEAVIIGQRLASGPLFRNRSKPSQAIGSEHLGRIITKALEDLGVKQRPKDGVSPHALRHTAATEIIEAGVSREKLQRFLGHVHSQTTDIYTRGAAFDLRAVHEARGR